jgi:hypothetical protein
MRLAALIHDGLQGLDDVHALSFYLARMSVGDMQVR